MERSACLLLCCFCLAMLRSAGAAGRTGEVDQPSDAVLLQRFASEPGVLLRRTTVVREQADGTGTRDIEVSYRVQADAVARQLSVLSVDFPSAAERAEYVYVRVRHADGTVTETDVAGAMEQPEEVTRQAPFYSDLKSLQLPVRGLGTGDTLEWKARLTEFKPEIPGQFWGQEMVVQDGVALHESLELHVPAATAVTLYTSPELTAPTDTKSGAERVIVWTTKNLQPTVGPAADAAKKKPLTPEKELALRKGPLPAFGWTTFPSWEAVGMWYQGLESDRMQPDPAITAKVAQLTSVKATEQEKAFALYQYVATQVRYVGVAFGVGRYQPHTAAEVLANQYGDCKDKHTLLAAMLQTIGLKPAAVLVGAGLRFDAALPSPGSFNHLMTQVMLDGKVVWLDTTAEVAPWDTLLPQVRDQESLVVPETGEPMVERTPALPPFPAYGAMVAKETLDGSLTSDARITLTFHDDDEIGLRAALRQFSPAQYQEVVQRLVASLGFGGTVSEPEIGALNDLGKPLTISYRYKRVKEEAWGTNRVTEPFWPTSMPVIDEKDPPVASIELGAPRTETSTVTMELPPGWSAEVPEATHSKTAYAAADVTYSLKGGQLVAERKLTVLQPRIPATEWRAYKKWATDAGVLDVPYVQLIPKGSPTPTVAAGGATAVVKTGDAAGTSAPALIQEAAAALQSLQVEQARELLEKAKALDPKAKGLWGMYAYVSYQNGEVNRAGEEAEKELAAYPDEFSLYPFVAEVQQRQGKNGAAEATLETWHKAVPDAPEPVLELMKLYGREKRASDGIAIGAAALQRLGTSGTSLVGFRLTLASLEREAGRKSDAAEVVRPLARTVEDPQQQNGVAYILADARVDLSQDETTETDVLKKLDAETMGWTLDENGALLQRKTNLLVACWDTMGWILFQEGHAAEAASYIDAAWLNRPNEEVTAHRTTVHAALHRDERDDGRSDQQRRTLRLEAAAGRHGTRQVKVLLGGGKVLRAEVTGAPGEAPLDAEKATALAMKADVARFFPAGSGAHLVRYGVVNCAGTSCDLVLYPMGAS